MSINWIIINYCRSHHRFKNLILSFVVVGVGVIENLLLIDSGCMRSLFSELFYLGCFHAWNWSLAQSISLSFIWDDKTNWSAKNDDLVTYCLFPAISNHSILKYLRFSQLDIINWTNKKRWVFLTKLKN